MVFCLWSRTVPYGARRSQPRRKYGAKTHARTSHTGLTFVAASPPEIRCLTTPTAKASMHCFGNRITERPLRRVHSPLQRRARGERKLESPKWMELLLHAYVGF